MATLRERVSKGLRLSSDTLDLPLHSSTGSVGGKKKSNKLLYLAAVLGAILFLAVSIYLFGGYKKDSKAEFKAKFKEKFDRLRKEKGRAVEPRKRRNVNLEESSENDDQVEQNNRELAQLLDEGQEEHTQRQEQKGPRRERNKPEQKSEYQILSPCKVLCVGDDWTKGSTSVPSKTFPYSIRLQHLVNKRYGTRKCQIVNAGQKLESSEFLLKRIQRILTSASKSNQTFTHFIVQSGSFDLFGKTQFMLETSTRNMIQVHSLLASTGAAVIGLTVPPSMEEQKKPSLKSNRIAFNNNLKTLIPSTKWIDLDQHFRAEDPYIGSNGYHLNEAGYEKLGNIVFEMLIEHIKEEKTEQPD